MNDELAERVEKLEKLTESMLIHMGAQDKRIRTLSERLENGNGDNVPRD